MLGRSLFYGSGIGLSFLPLVYRNGTLPVSPTYNPSAAIGSRWGSNYSRANFIGSGIRRYVNPSTGNNSNPGTSGSPWATLAFAITTCNSGDVIEIQDNARIAPISIPDFKFVSILASANKRVIIGDLITEAGISAWGSPSGGYQTCTLVSGTVGGFADLTVNRVGYPVVSRYCANTTAGNARKAEGYAAIIRGTPSILGATDNRDLAGEADTQLIMWRTNAATPVTMGLFSTLFLGDGMVIAGNEVNVRSSTLIMDNAMFLGSAGQCIQANSGTLIFYQACVRGAFNDDTVDYHGASNGCELFSVIDQSGDGTADDGSTTHEEDIVFSVGCTYGGKRPIHDIATTPRLLVDSTLVAYPEGGDSALTTGAPIWIQGLSLTSSNLDSINTASGPLYLIDQLKTDYTISTPANATEMSSGVRYNDPAIIPATPGSDSPLGWFDANDASSLISSGSTVSAWNNLSGAAANLDAVAGAPQAIVDNDCPRRVLYCPTSASRVAKLSSAGIATPLNNAQALTLHAIVKAQNVEAAVMVALGTVANGLYEFAVTGSALQSVLRIASASAALANVDPQVRRWMHLCYRFNGSSFVLNRDRYQLSIAASVTIAFADEILVNARDNAGTPGDGGTIYVGEIALWDSYKSDSYVAQLRQRAINFYGAAL